MSFLCVSLASPFYLIQSATADIYPVILHGKVVMEDGSPPPVVVSIERVCSDIAGSMPGVLTDKKGEYIWRMNIDPLEQRNCVIRATSRRLYLQRSGSFRHGHYSHHSRSPADHDSQFGGRSREHQFFGKRHCRPRKVGLYGCQESRWTPGICRGRRATWKRWLRPLPKSAQAWHALGVIDESLQKTSEARAAYEHAIAADPKMVPPYVMLARLCIKTKDWDCAAKTADA